MLSTAWISSAAAVSTVYSADQLTFSADMDSALACQCLFSWCSCLLDDMSAQAASHHMPQDDVQFCYVRPCHQWLHRTKGHSVPCWTCFKGWMKCTTRAKIDRFHAASKSILTTIAYTSYTESQDQLSYSKPYAACLNLLALRIQ